jgi:succinate dehydrogenase/fumarate reductase iron-sulfur protein
MPEETKTVNVRILRSRPGKGEEPKSETYSVPIEGKTSLLNALDYISEKLDPSLGYYSSCRIGKCMGCQVMIDGKVRFACTTLVQGDVTLMPLRKFKVIKDLVVDRQEKDEGPGSSSTTKS